MLNISVNSALLRIKRVVLSVKKSHIVRVCRSKHSVADQISEESAEDADVDELHCISKIYESSEEKFKGKHMLKSIIKKYLWNLTLVHHAV